MAFNNSSNQNSFESLAGTEKDFQMKLKEMQESGNISVGNVARLSGDLSQLDSNSNAKYEFADFGSEGWAALAPTPGLESNSGMMTLDLTGDINTGRQVKSYYLGK